jgi:hypothetical protein
MKILQENWRSTTPDEHDDMEHAVPAKTYRASYSTDGQLETLRDRVAELECIVGRLCDVLSLAPEHIETILGYGFKVQP